MEASGDISHSQQDYVHQKTGMKRLHVEAGGRNSISNKAVNSQCSSTNNLLASLATPDWTSLSKLPSVSEQQSAVDELDDFSRHCWLVL